MKFIEKPKKSKVINAIQLSQQFFAGEEILANVGDWLCVDDDGNQFFITDIKLREEFVEEVIEQPVTPINHQQIPQPNNAAIKQEQAKFMPEGYNPREGLMGGGY